MLSLYNRVKRDYFVSRSYCGAITATNNMVDRKQGNYRQSIVYPKVYKDVDQLQNTFNEIDFFKLYIFIRFAEEESSFTEQQKNLMLKQLIEHYRSFGIDNAIMKFERILNKPFDYAGSAGYYREQQKRNRDKMKKEAEGVRVSEGSPMASSFSFTGGGGY